MSSLAAGRSSYIWRNNTFKPTFKLNIQQWHLWIDHTFTNKGHGNCAISDWNSHGIRSTKHVITWIWFYPKFSFGLHGLTRDVKVALDHMYSADSEELAYCLYLCSGDDSQGKENSAGWQDQDNWAFCCVIAPSTGQGMSHTHCSLLTAWKRWQQKLHPLKDFLTKSCWDINYCSLKTEEMGRNV